MVESVPPKVSSPFVTDSTVVGSNETATDFVVMDPREYKLSVTKSLISA